ncbi:Leucine-rich repeat-containing protein 34 [Nowakowskiella sp. JEL0078]|nr:Leucine-rich repeat-containing protein 34 [Nowakowskiella sp. JEL0078]
MKESRFHVSQDAIKTLALTLESSPIKSISIDHQEMNVRIILDGMVDNKSITSLELITDKFNSESILAIRDYLTSNSTITALSLKGAFERASIRIFTKSLSSNTSLTSLELDSNSLGEESQLFGQMLTNNKTLKSLTLTNNDVETEGGVAIAEALKTNKTLQHLNLGNNVIDSDSAKVFAEMLKTNSTLESLNLLSNLISGDDISEICDSLQENKSLKVLILNDNYLQTSGNSFRRLLEKNNTLEILGLENSNLGIDDKQAIADGLKVNKGLKKLDFEKNYLVDDDAVNFAKVIKENSTLKQLLLAGTSSYLGEIGINGSVALGEALKLNESLETLTLGSNQISAEGAAPIIKAIQGNPKLKISPIDTLLVSAESDGSTLLHVSAEMNSIEIMEILLDRGEALEATDSESNTPLHIASKKKSYNCVELLLKRGANIEAKGVEGRTPIFFAIYEQDLQMISLLLDHGAAIEATNEYGDQPLIVACVLGYADVVKLLASRGANVEAKGSKGIRPLHVAVIYDTPGRVEIINYLLNEKNAQIDSKFKKQTPLFLAKQEEIVELLCKKGANVNFSYLGKTVLFSMIQKGLVGCTRAIMNKGADLEVTYKGTTPLGYAITMGNLEICKLFDDTFLESKVFTGDCTPIVHAARYHKWDIVKYYLEKGANINASYDSALLIHWVCSHLPDNDDMDENEETEDNNNHDEEENVKPVTQLEILRLVLAEKSVDVNFKGGNGSTPLMWATSTDQNDLAKEIINHGADVNILNDEGMSALMYTINSSEDLEFVKFMVENGADTSLKNNEGNTVFHLAAINGKTDFIDYFRELGLPTDVKNNDGETVIEVTDEETEYNWNN